MVDISDHAKEKLALKAQLGQPIKLNYDDVVELIIMAIGDAHLSSDEIFQFNHINEFTQDQMTTDAKQLFTDFYEGFTGQRQIEVREYDLYEIAKEKFERIGGQNAKLDVKDISDLIIYVIRDGKISQYEYEKFQQTEFFKIYNMTDAAKLLYTEFQQGLDRIFGSMQSATGQRTTIFDREQSGSATYQIICAACNGIGKKRCPSCKGKGGISSSTIEEDEYGNMVYKDKWVYCSTCSTGYLSCAQCEGTGAVEG